MNITFEMAIRLMPSPRPRVMGKITFMPKKYTDQKKLIKAHLRGFKHFGKESVALRLTIGIRRAKSGGKRNLYSMPVGDCDNYAKTLLDACEGVLFENDRQITDLCVTKRYADSDFFRAEFSRITENP